MAMLPPKQISIINFISPDLVRIPRIPAGSHISEDSWFLPPKEIKPFGHRREAPTARDMVVDDERMADMLAEGMRQGLIEAGLWKEGTIVPPLDVPTGDRVNENFWEII